MDHALIDMWNGRVQPKDIVYIVGDFCFRSGKPAEWYLKQLNGHKYLIIGNHDDKTLKNPEAMSHFDGADKMMDMRDDGKHICLCHYPITEWNSYYHGSWHIYGHIHNNKNEAYEIMKNMFLKSWNGRPGTSEDMGYPLVVIGAVPILTPLVTNGLSFSNGIVFLLIVMLTSSRAACAALPVIFLLVRSTSMR